MTWAPAYADTDAFRSYLAAPYEDPMTLTAIEEAEDDNIALALEAASRAVDRFCGRQFGATDGMTAEDRLYSPEWNLQQGAYLVEIDDLMSTTDLAIETTSGAVTDYTLRPLNAAGNSRPWTNIVFGESVDTALGSLVITAHWGWTAVPDTIVQATLLQAARLYKRKDAPFGIAGSPEMTAEMRLLAKIDPDVSVMLRDYRRWWAAA